MDLHDELHNRIRYHCCESPLRHFSIHRHPPSSLTRSTGQIAVFVCPGKKSSVGKASMEESLFPWNSRSMTNREPITSLRTPQTPMGVLTDRELLLVDLVQGKRVLHARVLPREADALGGLLDYLWQEAVSSVWVLPSTRLSQRVTCAELEQLSTTGPRSSTLLRPSPPGRAVPSSGQRRVRSVRRVVLPWPFPNTPAGTGGSPMRRACWPPRPTWTNSWAGT